MRGVEAFTYILLVVNTGTSNQEIRTSLDDFLKYRCPAASCRYNCGSEVGNLCYCDERCLELADCCPDYIQECMPTYLTDLLHGREQEPPRDAVPPPIGPIGQEPPRDAVPPPMGPVGQEPLRAAVPPPTGPIGHEPPRAAVPPQTGPVGQEPPRDAVPPPMGPVGQQPPRDAVPPPMGPVGQEPPRDAVPPPMGPVGQEPPGAAVPPTGPVGQGPSRDAVPPTGPIGQGPPRDAVPPPIGPVEQEPPRDAVPPPMGPVGQETPGAAVPPTGPIGQEPPRDAVPPPMGPVGQEPPGDAIPPPMGPVGQEPPRDAVPPPTGPIGQKPLRDAIPPPMGPVAQEPPRAAVPPPTGPIGHEPPRAAVPPPTGPVGQEPPRDAVPPPMGPVGQEPPRDAVPPTMGPVGQEPPGAAIQPSTRPVGQGPPRGAVPPPMGPVGQGSPRVEVPLPTSSNYGYYLEILTNVTQSLNKKQKYECKKLPGSLNSEYISMVTQCLPVPAIVNDSVVNDCESESNDYIKNTPVFYEGNFYKNQDCVTCNIRSANLSLISHSRIKFICDNDTIRDIAINVYKDRGQEKFLSFVSSNCPVMYDINPKFNLPLSSRRFRHCNIIQSCDLRNFKGSAEMFLQSKMLCMSYRAPLLIDHSYDYIGNGGDKHKYNYMNIHCAICNGAIQSETEVSCNSLPTQATNQWSNIPSFSILLDIKGKPKPLMNFAYSTMCPAGGNFDITKQECLQSDCDNGLTNVGGMCVRVDSGVTSLSTRVETTFNNILIVISASSTEDILENETQVAIQQLKGVEKKGILTYCMEIFPWLRDTKISDRLNHICVILELKRKHLGPLYIFPATLTELSYANEIIGKTFEIVQHQKIVYYHLPWNLFESDNSECGSDAYEPILSHDIYFVQKYGTHDVGVNVSYRNYLLDPKMSNIGLSLSYNKNDSKWENANVFGIFCVLRVLLCNYTLVPIGSTITKDGSLYMNIHNSEYYAKDGSYLLLPSNYYLVCKDEIIYSRSGSTNAWYDKAFVDKVKSMLTIVCNSISLAFLLLTVITYCTFRPLKTLPGLSILNLSISLFLAQLSFNFNHLLLQWKNYCTLLAILQHYLWLVSFCWMNTLAVISCRTFSNSMTSIAHNDFRFEMPMLYSWGVPLVFVGLSFGVQFFSDLNFKYGGNLNCWIEGFDGLVYFFAVPLTFLLTINAVLFSLTIVALRRTRNEVEMATGSENKTQSLIIIKLSSVIGLTWVFGLIANISPELEFLWFPFIVCNALQGVFICASFTLNKRVFTMYRDLCGCKLNINKPNSSTPKVTEEAITGQRSLL